MILDVLGRGGMGAVYAAYDPELDRRVALKLLSTTRASEQGRKRLVREARALAKLSHPNVVHVYDAGMHEGDVFVAMELVEGKSLKSWCKNELLLLLAQLGRELLAELVGLEHRANLDLGLLAGHRIGAAPTHSIASSVRHPANASRFAITTCRDFETSPQSSP
jgi:serine/threonine protein kinase